MKEKNAVSPESTGAEREARYWDRLGDKKIRCRLCPHECRVADLERGTCGVRENRGGKYYTLVYGNPCSAHIDPIEKKPLFHYLPSTQAFSLATAGCNFACKFCQNWEISQKRPEQVKSISLPPDSVIAFAMRNHCATIAHTYTEPVVFFEYLLDCAIRGKTQGLPNVMITNGYIRAEPMKELCRYLGAVKVDLKAFSEKFYREVCQGKLQPVLDTLKLIKSAGTWLEIVVLIIPNLNDSPVEIGEMSRWIVRELGADVPLHFSRFYPTFMMQNTSPTPPAVLDRCRKIALDAGINYVYIGNILSDAQNTVCPRCKKTVVERIGFAAQLVGLKKNSCKYCGATIAGVF